MTVEGETDRGEDLLSDAIPSNIVSRQPSDGGDVESEYDDEVEVPMDDEDELDPDDSAGQASTSALPSQPSPSRKGGKKNAKWQNVLPSLSTQRADLDKAKISDAVKRYSYLLGQTELFKYFVDIKV